MAYKKQKGGPKMYRKDGALPMKSPMKNINNMKAYSKPGDAVQFGDGIKMHGKHDGPKMYGSPNEMEKAPTYMKSPNEMKSSGFKMKSGSPFQRNFGIGASPVKAAKPDYPDIDGDGNTTESMKQAAADKKGPLEMASPMKVVDAYDTEYVESMTKDYHTDKYGNVVEKRNVSPQSMKEIMNIYEGHVDKSKYPTFEDYLNSSQKTSEGTQSYSVERKTDKDDATTTSADDFFKVNRKFQNRLKNKMPVDWHKSFTGNEGLAAAKQALEEGTIDQTKYDELTSVYNTQLEREAVNQQGTDEGKVDKAVREIMAENPGMEKQVAANMVSGNPEEYGLTEEISTSASGSILDEEGSYLADDIVSGDKEKFETNFIKNLVNEGLTESEAKEKLATYYSGMERIKETGSVRKN